MSSGQACVMAAAKKEAIDEIETRLPPTITFLLP